VWVRSSEPGRYFGRWVTRNCSFRTIGCSLLVLKALSAWHSWVLYLGHQAFLLRSKERFLAAYSHSSLASTEVTIRTETKSKVPRYIFGKSLSKSWVSKDTFLGTASGWGNWSL
jgi:hypothetical protein